MVSNTPYYGWPYPSSTDRLDEAVTSIPRDLALAIESTLRGWGGLAAPGAWEVVGSAGKAAFGAGWAAYGAPFAVPAYRKVGSQVFLRGTFKNTTGAGSAVPSTLFTLPAGYRPTAQVIGIVGDASAAYRQVSVSAAGLVNVYQSIAAGGDVSIHGYIWLD